MRCLLCSSLENVDDRGAYPVCAECKQEQLDCADRLASGEMLDRDCGPLCMRCGLCCSVLSARITPEEVEHLATWSGKLPTEIAMVEKEPFPEAGKLVLHRPCVFLMGKITEYVACKVYKTKRSEVCEEYLCRMAVRYKAGLCTLNEALFILKSSITHRGSPSDFNWSPDEGADKGDHEIVGLLAAKRVLSTMDADDDRAAMVRFYLFKKFSKRYVFASSVEEAVFAAIMVNLENNALQLDQFFEAGLTDGWSDRDYDIALRTIYQVVGDFRKLFVEEGSSV